MSSPYSVSLSVSPSVSPHVRLQRAGIMRSSLAATLLVFLSFGVAGCRGEVAPTWVPLTELLSKEVNAGESSFRDTWHPGRAMKLVTKEDGAQLRMELRRDDWTFEPEYHVWSMPSGLKLPKNRDVGALELLTTAGSVPEGKLTDVLHGRGLKGFALFRGRLVLGTKEDAPPPELATLVYGMPGTSTRSGARIFGTDFAADGITILAGESARGKVSVPSNSALRFGTIVDPILGGGGEVRESLFRVLLDGELLFEDRQEVPADLEHSITTWHTVALPSGANASASLVFEVAGDLQNTAILDPMLGPAGIGRHGERPWPSVQPDIVVFLADTFRPDNLSAYGGRHGVARNLDKLAEESLVFVRAWSSAPWTLPAHATLFSGFYPPQVRTTDRGGRLPEDVTTIAELLAASGYRTGSITDSGLVSSNFGLDQGFQYFSERSRDIEVTLADARAFLEADDGRPCFLFVQSYHVHWPYVVSEETRAELGAELGIEGSAHDLLELALQEARAQGATAAREIPDLSGFESSPQFLKTAKALHAHYLGGVADFDRGTADFLAYLRATGVLDDGYLVFTSDHGESFAEHGDLFHGRKPFEEQTRIPLMIAGRGIQGTTSNLPASLIDLTPTLAEMAGLGRDPAWPGQSLLSKKESGPIYSFECSGEEGEALSMVAGDRKVLLVPEGETASDWKLIGAFDLASDGSELSDLTQSAAWPQSLVGEHSLELQHLLQSVVLGEEVQLGAEKEAELQALGY